MDREAVTIDALIPHVPHDVADDDAPLAPGTALGPYRIAHVLGEGGMGRVYLGVHDVIGRRVALKVLKRSLASEPRSVGRFFVEAQLVNRIRHPGIVEVTDLFVVGRMPCIVMELLEGTTWAAAIAARALTLDAILDVAAQTADALHAAHAAGVVHRDLKPENVLLVPKRGAGEPSVVVKVLDFGIATLADSHDGAIVGTPEYMAPEQLAGGPIDARVDVYALGVSLFHAATARLPFPQRDLRSLVEHQRFHAPPSPRDLARVPDGLDELILRMLAKDPRNRPQSMAEVARALRALRRRTKHLVHAALGATAAVLVAALAFALGRPPSVEQPAVAQAHGEPPERSTWPEQMSTEVVPPPVVRVPAPVEPLAKTKKAMVTVDKTPKRARSPAVRGMNRRAVLDPFREE